MKMQSVSINKYTWPISQRILCKLVGILLPIVIHNESLFSGIFARNSVNLWIIMVPNYQQKPEHLP